MSNDDSKVDDNFAEVVPVYLNDISHVWIYGILLLRDSQAHAEIVTATVCL